MKSGLFAALLLFGASSLALAQEFPVKTLESGAILCFDSDDWDSMVEASADDDNAAALRLIASGACRTLSKPAKVLYLDKAAGGSGVLIQMPSGKGAYTAEAFIK